MARLHACRWYALQIFHRGVTNSIQFNFFFEMEDGIFFEVKMIAL